MSGTTTTQSEKSEKIALSIPSGTRDFHPQQVKIREEMFTTIRSIFERHGAVRMSERIFRHSTSGFREP